MAASSHKLPTEYFERMGSKLKKQNMEQTTIKSTSDAGISTAYCHYQVPSTSNNIYEWTLKINNGGKGVMVIGISASNKDIDSPFYKNTNIPNYGYNLFSGFKVSCASFAKYGKKAKTSDYITTILDLNKATISYHINGNTQAIAHNVQQNEAIKYRFCVSIQDNQDMVTLTNFKITNTVQKTDSTQILAADNNLLMQEQLQLLNADLKNKISLLETAATKNIRTSRDLNELKQENILLKQENIALKTAAIESKQKMDVFENENNVLKVQVNILEHEKKDNEMKINELNDKIQELKMKLIDINRFREWNEEDVLNWIFSINNGLFLKYENELRYEIMECEIKGIDLLKIKRKDIKDFGVKTFSDQKILEEKIDMLRAINDVNYNNGQEYGQVVAPVYGEPEGVNIVDTAKGVPVEKEYV